MDRSTSNQLHEISTVNCTWVENIRLVMKTDDNHHDHLDKTNLETRLDLPEILIGNHRPSSCPKYTKGKKLVLF